MRQSSSTQKALLLLPLITFMGCGSEKPVDYNKQATLESSGISEEKDSSFENSVNEKSPTREANLKTGTPSQPTAPTNDRELLIARAENHTERGEFASAEKLLKSALLTNPEDVEVIFRLASTVAAAGNLTAAIEYLDAIPIEHPDAGLPAIGQSADWHFQLEYFDEAEKKYRQILELIPNAAEAHRKLAYLYNRQGRRHEAATHIRELCKLGNVLQDELHSLIHLSDAMFDERPSSDENRSPSNTNSSPLSNERPYWPIGELAEARKEFAEHAYQSAANRLKKQVDGESTNQATLALLGRASAEAQDDEGVQIWLNNLTPESKNHPEHWAALGLILLQENKIEQAARALMEALQRDPTDFRSMSRLRSVLESMEDSDHAGLIEQRFQTLQAISKNSNQIVDASTPNVDAMRSLAQRLESIDRKAESALWKLLAGFRQQLPKQQMMDLQSQLQSVIKNGTGFPDTLSKLCGLDIESFPLPDLESLRITRQEESKVASSAVSKIQIDPTFENIADQVDLKHAYRIASDPQEDGFSVYQSVGGAVAVIDFDRDGKQDLYFAQGAANPPSFVGEEGNQLYRSLNQKLTDVSLVSETEVKQYSIGATTGDWNQDGFPDLIVSNIGSNTLLINNGDGTFSDRVIDNRNDKNLMSTSLAVADVNGDQLPDLFEVNYLHDENLPKRPKRNDAGEVIETLMPKDFQSAFDRIVLQDRTGTLSYHELNRTDSDARAGLGVVIGDFDHQPGNEIFVGNDVDANQFWSSDQSPAQWNDIAKLRGCAYGFSGAKTASMGIASGDFDRNGWMDIHITNFQGESASHYLNNNSFFRDRNLQYGISEPSRGVLGFGSQAIDYDLDGDLDLAVTNGHIENSVTTRDQFKQPAQMFSNAGDRFKLAKVKDRSRYWSELHVGRGLARLDWNRDGKPDLVITHQSEATALLINQTDTDNHWLQIEVCGTKSERDAIGARVEVHLGKQVLTEWVTAGDGFLCKNEATMFFGLGTTDKVERIVVYWPTGEAQVFSQTLEADQKILLIENQSTPFEMHPSF